MHPLKPWLLTCDKDKEIYLWDYSMNNMIFRKTINEIYSTINNDDFEYQNTSSTTKNETKIEIRNEHVSNVNYLNKYQMKKNKQKGYHTSSITKEILNKSILISNNGNNTNNYNATIYNSHTHEQMNSSITKKNKETKNNYGEIKKIAFIDRLSLSHYCNINIPPHESNFQSDSYIMIICDANIIFYDFILNTSITILPEKERENNMNNKNNESYTFQKFDKLASKCLLFLSRNICAVGLGDGQIILRDISNNADSSSSGGGGDSIRNKIIKVLSGHSKEIVLLKIFIVLNRCEYYHRFISLFSIT